MSDVNARRYRVSLRGRGGFTLLEVMMAIAILGLGLTAILSAQAGSLASARHARNISLATGLLRCKMNEVEEYLMRNGYPEMDLNESGVCCEGDTTPNMTCAWKVEKPQLPDGKFGELNLNAALGSGLDGQGDVGSSLLGGAAGSAAPPSGGAPGDLTSFLSGVTTGASAGGAAGGLGALGGAAGALGGAGGMAGIAGMVMSMVYPNLKLLLEASTRRATVTLTWKEGQKEYSMTLMQWLANPQKPIIPDELRDAAQNAAGGTNTGVTGNGAGAGTGLGGLGGPGLGGLLGGGR